MQREYFGIGSVERLEQILVQERPTKIFLVTGKKSYASSGAQAKLEPILSLYPSVQFSGFATNPNIEDIRRGVDLYQRERCDFVIAVGGGSVIDLAKAVNILAIQTDLPEKYILKEKDMESGGKTLVAIPTTSGSGSEATHFAVIYINAKKYSLTHQSLLPDYSILDPGLTTTLPKEITAVTGMDALGQAIEAYWSVNSTEESRRYSKEAISLILPNFKLAVNQPTIQARVAMMAAANLAGKAINIAQTTASHALSYSLTSNFGIPHGHAVALTLGQAFEYNSMITNEDCNDRRGVDYVKRMMADLILILGCRTATEAKNGIKELMSSIGLETDLFKLGVKEKDLSGIVSTVNLERLKNNPRRFPSTKQLKELFF
ncbi:MAG TPA: phosphonoacetaldehyde reductase [Candidatus Nanoarchaeia archaeon]|nr:phosphonoacetaldehyde reductase [Candidatus Nanoarchaeia archaeon]